MMNQMESTIIPASDGFPLHAYDLPVKDPRAVAIVVHGANEHAGRYGKLFKMLNEAHFSVIAADHRGHGHSVTREHPRSYMESLDEVIADMATVVRFAKRLNPGLPIYMIAHSMGSLFARVFLQQHDHLIDKLALSAPVKYMPIIPFAQAIIEPIKMIRGKNAKSRFVTYIGSGTRRDSEWVSNDPTRRRKFKADPLNFNEYDIQGYAVLLASIRALADYRSFHCSNPNLPIIMQSGEADIFAGDIWKIKSTRRALLRYGYHRIHCRIYRGFRHEILNEQDNSHILNDLIAFLA